LSETEKQKHAEGMTDEELVHHVESRLRPVGESLRNLIPYIQEAHATLCVGAASSPSLIVAFSRLPLVYAVSVAIKRKHRAQAQLGGAWLQRYTA
jgi:hypothetical protein